MNLTRGDRCDDVHLTVLVPSTIRVLPHPGKEQRECKGAWLAMLVPTVLAPPRRHRSRSAHVTYRAGSFRTTVQFQFTPRALAPAMAEVSDQDPPAAAAVADLAAPLHTALVALPGFVQS